MKQAIHIFRKDVRRFTYEIGVLGALTALWTWTQIADPNRYGHAVSVILALSWWFVISQLVHEESLTGDRLFWITRPYSRGSLLAAKTLFVAVFINVPLLLGGVTILAAAGYRPLAFLPNFLWMQFTFTATVLLLPAALAAVTRTLVQFVLSILGIIAVYLTLGIVAGQYAQPQTLYRATGFAWAHNLVLLAMAGVPALTMFLLQLKVRKRLLSASLGAALFFLLGLPDYSGVDRLAGVVQSRMFGEGAGPVNVTVDATGVKRDATALMVPLRIENIPEGTTAAPQLIELELTHAGGQRWTSGWIPAASSDADVFQKDPSPVGTFAWKQRVVVDRAFWQGARSSPVSIRGNVSVMLYRRRSVALRVPGVTRLPDGGDCTAAQASAGTGNWVMVTCRAPFHEPFNRSETEPARILSVWDSPFPADFGMNPLSTNIAASRDADVTFLRYNPRAYICRSFESPR